MVEFFMPTNANFKTREQTRESIEQSPVQWHTCSDSHNLSSSGPYLLRRDCWRGYAEMPIEERVDSSDFLCELFLLGLIGVNTVVVAVVFGDCVVS